MGEKDLYDEHYENGIIYRVKKINVDPNDWSWRVKKKYDKIDKKRSDRLKYHVDNFGKEKYKKEKAKWGSRHLGRWGFKA